MSELNTMEEIDAEVEERLAYYRKLRDSLERACVYLEIVDQLVWRASGYQHGMTNKAVVDMLGETYGDSRNWMPTLALEHQAGEFTKRVSALRETIEKVRQAQEHEGKNRLRLTGKMDMIERLLEKANDCFLDDKAMA